MEFIYGEYIANPIKGTVVAHDPDRDRRGVGFPERHRKTYLVDFEEWPDNLPSEASKQGRVWCSESALREREW